ncbi:DinB family protein [Kutzneria albida]|uniref:Mini-circle protein n=1 Tax=Kutzneria albida DSM 43870 TaxID=1449976 RepID=W5W3R9_9PSEU|nr:DinB family protein [Kutzneria albida]AHH95863.1 hypothetical protein KALB_2495 [Kutzneria albida DSM 43870]
MPALVETVADERTALLAFLAEQRAGLRRAVLGLDERQAGQRPTVSALTLGGLIKHAVHVERFWIDEVLRQLPAGDKPDWAAQFEIGAEEDLPGWLAAYKQAAAHTERIVAELPTLEVTAPLPRAPWFPENAVRSARWILLHLIEETARHAGHADILRESLDGRTAYELMAAAQ